MPAFFVHGVPDTAHLWDRVRDHLSRADVIAPNLPGFGAPLPAGFDCTMDAYAAWLIDQIEEAAAPVDLVGHDWGSLLVQRVVSLRPDVIRTWAAGGAPLDPEYVWHDTAKIWQTPSAGERFMQAMTPELMAGALSQQGIDPADAAAVGSRIDETMKSSILTLYRSAVNIGKDWPPLADRDKRGLVLWGADDPYCPASFAQRLGGRTGAKVLVFEDCSHWWPHQRPRETAKALEELWASA